jgi:hypothetical protein
MAKDGLWQQHFGKLCIALTSLSTLVGHYIINNTNRVTVKEQIETVVNDKIGNTTVQGYEQRLERERSFVRKEDLEKLAKGLADRIDQAGDKVEDLAERTSQLEGYLRAKEQKRSESTVTFWRRAYQRKR